MSTDQVLNAVTTTVSPDARLRVFRNAAHKCRKLTADHLAPATFFVIYLAVKGTRVPALLGQIETSAGSDRGLLYVELANNLLVCLFLALVVGLYLLRRPSLRKNASAGQKAIALAGSLLPITLALAPTTFPGLATSLTASLLALAGMAIAITGLWTLRGCFGIFPEVRGLVTGGIYCRVRHPLYSGETLAVIGIALPLMSALTFVILVAYVVLQWRRALHEEAILTSTFPEYREYSAHTRQFIPFLW